MNNDYSRGYSKGYWAASRRHGQYTQKLLKIAHGYRDAIVSKDADRRCETCARWQRGHAGNEKVKWGYCEGSFPETYLGGWWAEGRDQKAAGKIVTQINFGCNAWLPRSQPKAPNP